MDEQHGQRMAQKVKERVQKSCALPPGTQLDATEIMKLRCHSSPITFSLNTHKQNTHVNLHSHQLHVCPSVTSTNRNFSIKN
jgi:hypothetical protein